MNSSSPPSFPPVLATPRPELEQPGPEAPARNHRGAWRRRASGLALALAATTALGIGADGTVVGASDLAGGGLQASAWSGRMVPLAVLGGTVSGAVRRTSSGDIYGFAFDPSGLPHVVRRRKALSRP